MIYFYGGAFNPMTRSHLKIIKYIVNLLEDGKLVIGITSHDYKTYEFDYELRKRIVEDNIKEFSDKIEIVKQDQRTWKFFQTLPYKQITMVIGEDEWKDLKAGKWHYSNDILNTYNILTIPRTDDVSSSKVRELLKENAGKNELLKYITEITYNILKGVENE